MLVAHLERAALARGDDAVGASDVQDVVRVGAQQVGEAARGAAAIA